MDGVMEIDEGHRKLQQGRSGAIHCAMNRAATKRALVYTNLKLTSEHHATDLLRFKPISVGNTNSDCPSPRLVSDHTATEHSEQMPTIASG